MEETVEERDNGGKKKRGEKAIKSTSGKERGKENRGVGKGKAIKTTTGRAKGKRESGKKKETKVGKGGKRKVGKGTGKEKH